MFSLLALCGVVAVSAWPTGAGQCQVPETLEGTAINGMLSRGRNGTLQVSVSPETVSAPLQAVTVTLKVDKGILGFHMAAFTDDGTKIGSWLVDQRSRLPFECEKEQGNVGLPADRALTLTHRETLAPFGTTVANFTFFAPADAVDGEKYSFRIVTLIGDENDKNQMAGEFALNRDASVVVKLVQVTDAPSVIITRVTKPAPNGSPAALLGASLAVLLSAVVATF